MQTNQNLGRKLITYLVLPSGDEFRWDYDNLCCYHATPEMIIWILLFCQKYSYIKPGKKKSYELLLLERNKKRRNTELIYNYTNIKYIFNR